MSESIKLVYYIIKQAELYKNIYFTIRQHPGYELNKNILHQLQEIQNIRISEFSTLQDDIINNDFLIYWSSTVALEAIMFRMPVIRYNHEVEILSSDPIFDLKNFKININNDESVYEKIDEFSKLKKHHVFKELSLSQSFVTKYFHQYNHFKQ